LNFLYEYKGYDLSSVLSLYFINLQEQCIYLNSEASPTKSYCYTEGEEKHEFSV